MKVKSIARLSENEEVELRECETIIEQNLTAFLLVGMALMLIQSRKLYRKTHSTFELYVNERWKLSKPYAYRLVAASKAFQHIKESVPDGDKVVLPETEAQLRYLTHLSPDKQGFVWLQAVSEKNGKAPTADEIKAIVDRLNEQERSLVLQMSKEIREETSEEIREERIEKIRKTTAKNAPMSKKEYPIVYADPPWAYSFERSESRKIENKYPTMEYDEIARIPIRASETSMLLLWTTTAKLPDGIRLIEDWGFEYKSSMVWIKRQLGMGYYARNQHEFLLIGTKGDFPVPLPKDRCGSVIVADRRAHSQKPDEIYDLIDRWYPALEKLEMFSRAKTPRKNWSYWGNEC